MTDRFDFFFFLKETITEETVKEKEILDENFGRVYVPHRVGVFT